jgi:hypothetical protein
MRCALFALAVFGELLLFSSALSAETKSPKTPSASAGPVLLGRFDLRMVEQARVGFSCHATSPSFNSALTISKGRLLVNSLKARQLGRSKQFTVRKRLGTQNHQFLIQVTSTSSRTVARLQERVWSDKTSACRFIYMGTFASR